LGYVVNSTTRTTKIITAKKQKKYYADNGNIITDETLIQDIQRGAHVISYREDKVEGDPMKPKRHIVHK